ncbi:MAG: tol-pal system protein YbgF [Betaproteobacteria bacterium]
MSPLRASAPFPGFRVRVGTGLSALALAVSLLASAGAAHASLFGDDEARKAILELRGRLTAVDEASKARDAEAQQAQSQALAQALARQAAQLTQQSTQQMAQQAAAFEELVQALKRGIFDLNGQIEGLKTEIARLRGSQEQLARDVAEVQKRQRDLAQAADDRITRLEPLKVSLDGQDFMAVPDEKRSYDEALAIMRTGDFDKALGALSAFQRRYPGSGYAEAARFWTANALYGKRDYKEAVAAFRAFVNAAPKHPRAPEALLALANSQAEMKDRPGARKTIDELMKTYPQSEAAQAGKERLATLK